MSDSNRQPSPAADFGVFHPGGRESERPMTALHRVSFVFANRSEPLAMEDMR